VGLPLKPGRSAPQSPFIQRSAMSIASIPDIRFLPATHRGHPFVLDFVVALASVGSYLKAYHGLPVTTFAPTQSPTGLRYPTVSIAGLASGRTIDFVPHDLLQDVFVANGRTPAIAYIEKPEFIQVAGVSTSAMAETLEGFAQAMFTRYWETNLSTIEAVHGQRSGRSWPQVLRFAAIARDAMSHGGTLHMFPSVASATHFGLTYVSAQNGRRILHNDLTSAGLFLLMLDVDATF